MHFTIVRTATIKKKSNNNKCWQVCRDIGTLVHSWLHCETELLWKNSREILQKN